MYQVELIKELKCRLFSRNNNIASRQTIIYVPGSGTIGKNKDKTIKEIINNHPEFNIITFIYKSHQTNNLTEFENDIDDLVKVVHKLENEGLKKEDIGFLSTCYGSFLTAQYLLENEGHAYSFMIEPFLGNKSFNKRMRLVMGFINILYKIGIKNLPIGKRYEPNSYIKIEPLLKIIKKEINPIRNTPLLVIKTRYHNLFEEDYLRRWTEESNGVFKKIDKKTKKQTITEIVKEIEKFRKTNK